MGKTIFHMDWIFLFFSCRQESRGEKLWIPPDSDYISNKQWLDTNFPQNRRYHSALFVSPDENVLTPQYLLQMLELRDKVSSIKVFNKTFEDLCYRVPIGDIFLAKKKRRKRQSQISKEEDEDSVYIQDYFDEKHISVVNTSISVNTQNQQQAVFSERSPKSIDLNETTEEEISNPFGDSYSDSYYGDYYGDYYDDEDYEPSEDEIGGQASLAEALPRDIYCDLIDTLKEKCLEHSILELWKYDRDVISRLTTQDILKVGKIGFFSFTVCRNLRIFLTLKILHEINFDKNFEFTFSKAVNEETKSPIFGYDFDFTTLIGDITRNSTGHVIRAKSAAHLWSTNVNVEAIG